MTDDQPKDPFTRDDLVRRVSLGGVIIATAVISYTILRDRATNIGFVDWWTEWLYPVGLDALILGASRVWGQKNISRGTRRMAAIMTLSAIAAGIAAFIVEFYPQGWIAVGFACLIPASLAAALILTSRVAADKRDALKEAEQKKLNEMKNAPTPLPPPPVYPSYPPMNPPYQPPLGPYAPTYSPGPPTAPRIVNDVSVTARGEFPQEPIFDDLVVSDQDRTGTIPDPIAVHMEDLRRASVGLPPPLEDEHINERTITMPVIKSSGPRPDVPEPPAAQPRPRTASRRSEGVTADVRKAWVRDRLEKGIETTGADVDKQFPEGSRNGARIVRSVREAMEREERE